MALAQILESQENDLLFSPDITSHTSRDSVVDFTPTSNSDSSINYLNIYLIFCNHARLNLRIQQLVFEVKDVVVTIIQEVTKFSPSPSIRHQQPPCRARLAMATLPPTTLWFAILFLPSFSAAVVPRFSCKCTSLSSAFCHPFHVYIP